MTTTKQLRVVTASSLFDGHDAAINVLRRLFQKAGCEVIHIGHNRSVEQIITTALQEDVDAICVSSYQGGHMEFFRYLRDQLVANDADHIRILGGGGGTILPSEIETLHDYGITRLYHADDGRKLGLRGIIKDAISRVEKVYLTGELCDEVADGLAAKKMLSSEQLARALTAVEDQQEQPDAYAMITEALETSSVDAPPVLGVTGPGGAGKSSLVDELVTRFLYSSKKGRIGILAFDPTKRKTGGALLGDRVRMNAIYNDRVFLRSMSTGTGGAEVGPAVDHALALFKRSNFDVIILETTGIGQGDARIVDLADLTMYVMTSEYGASSQLEKIDMLDYADVVVINKFDRMGAEDAFEDVLHAYAHSRNKKATKENRNKFPIFGTIASDFNNPGVTRLYSYLIETLRKRTQFSGDVDLESVKDLSNDRTFTVIPPERTFYLGEIAEAIRRYKKQTEDKARLASHLYKLKTLDQEEPNLAGVVEAIPSAEKALGGDAQDLIDRYFSLHDAYQQPYYEYTIRDKVHRKPLFTESLSDSKIPRIATPRFRDWGDIYAFMRGENFPGHFPFTAGVFPLKSDAEDPKRQFAGEGSPQRTNKRFHYLCNGEPAKRLSTAFDSVTLYGEDPAERPDIYGKIGNSGVSIASLDDMKALYDGFDLVDPLTSVSLTINGPAPMILAMFLNTAVDFEVEKVTGGSREKCPPETYVEIKARVLRAVRGTVQADILKEEQAQNTCIFSSKFALKMMGDIQEYFTANKVRNFYSVSISGYHIAEAGANPITQLALTLANGFTYVEYYLARGMDINAFAPNLSFFFSSGLDPEYSVIGRVARRIWSVTLREKYGANDRACKLKYHIQTSGRSLHAQEIAFNDIRTTLQALLAVYDNCNSLHTNAYDEAITTPTEESVRRAMAIQLILTNEFGVSKCDNAMQGSYFYETLTELVEEAVLCEFDSLSRRGGVMGAMEKQYQRHQIQTESMKYEMQKASGELPIVGVNTFLGTENVDYEHIEVVRAEEKEKQSQIERTRRFIERSGDDNERSLERLRTVALSGENIFEQLMETVKVASLGQITHLLYQCGGEYRRSM
ncbi:Fused isobutyryl-CoA mutase [Chlamydiales bacterium SCGC AG-110-P3]|nr:Fused isobutyryl-CoA mutase [Chlamydiales bacterium SCGC AG-110-P3]